MKKITKQFDVKIIYYEDGSMAIPWQTKKSNIVKVSDFTALITGLVALQEKIIKHNKENYSGMDDLIDHKKSFDGSYFEN